MELDTNATIIILVKKTTITALSCYMYRSVQLSICLRLYDCKTLVLNTNVWANVLRARCLTRLTNYVSSFSQLMATDPHTIHPISVYLLRNSESVTTSLWISYNKDTKDKCSYCYVTKSC